MLFTLLATASCAVASTTSRSAKVALLATALREAGPVEVALAVSYLAGELPQRRTGVGHRSLTGLPNPAEHPSLQVAEVDAAFEQMAGATGAGSAGRRRALLLDVFSRATAVEQRLLAGLVSGELRQGALIGVVTDAVATAAGLALPDVRTALMLTGSLPVVATAALTTGDLSGFRLQVGRPLAPMLAQPGANLTAALARIARPVVECKLDGIRVQIHRDGDDVRVFTRTLDDITGRLPELVEVVRSLPVRSVVLDGEAIALRPDGTPLPFQVTASRAASRTGPVPLTPFFFDVLHLDGEDLLGRPLSQRSTALRRVVPERWRAPSTTEDFEAFAADALARGHEGVVVKDLDAPYDAGRRGGAWLKVKPVHTFDLVVLAAEWGHGRRTGRLSNLHLGARDGAGFVMLGKTFKGLTDELLDWQTDTLLALAVQREPWGVVVRPELVVEIAIDGVQTSPRYPGGIALRFARVLRYRPDKTADQADTLADLQRLHIPS
ncbi:MAG: ATP-dependent DNA ligase [Frankiales bacterium]|nr:ATP-dependent DNA ligase [Frankiales bacterium]